MAIKQNVPPATIPLKGPLSLRLLKMEQPVMFGIAREAGLAYAETRKGRQRRNTLQCYTFHTPKKIYKVSKLRDREVFWALQVFISPWERSYFRRVRESDLAFNISSSSFNRYFPLSSVSRRKLFSMIFVNPSASWAPE